MFSSSTFKTFVLLSILLRHVIGNSNPHPALQTGSDLPSSLDLHSDLSSRNDFTDAPSSNAEYAILLSEQASSLSPLDNGENVGSLVGAESDGCSSSTSTTQLSNKMRRRVKRDKGICDATQDTNQPDPITQPDQEQRGRQGNDGKNNPSSKNSPSMKPSPRPLKNGGADELCLSHGFFYRVCAPAYLESKIHLTNYNLDQCRPSMGLECNTDETDFCCRDISWNQPSIPSLSLPLFTTAYYSHMGYYCEKIGYTRPGHPDQSPWYWPF